MLYPGFFKQTVSVVRIEILVVIQKELCQYRVVVVHFQLAGIQTMDCPSVFFRQFKIKDLENTLPKVKRGDEEGRFPNQPQLSTIAERESE